MSKSTGKIDIEQMLGTLRYHPEIWDQPLLLQMSLGDLSKVLDKSLSRRRVLDTYLRWLEAHRLHPNHNSKYWEPLLVEWSQSLRNRGFEKDELIRDVKKWKENNGPFPSSLRRCTLMPFDIAKAFPEYREPWSTKQDYSGKPPGDYVCNRCDTPGHFLEACPTNMDPFFDKAPGPTYLCPLCRQWGKHYKSLCPLNEDPFSIIMKRRRQGIKTQGDSGFYTPSELNHEMLRDWEKERGIEAYEVYMERGRKLERSDRDRAMHFGSYDPKGSPSPTRSPSVQWTPKSKRNAQEIRKRIQELDEMKKHIKQNDEIGTGNVAMIRERPDSTLPDHPRVASLDSANTRFRRVLNEHSPSPTKARALRNQLAAIESAEARGESPSVDKARLLALLYNEEHGGIMDREYYIDAKKHELDQDACDIDTNRNALSCKRSKSLHTEQSPNKHIGEAMDVEMEDSPWRINSKHTTYSEFIQKLINANPGSMQQTVNTLRHRPTSLDMWNDYNNQRMKKTSILNAKKVSFGNTVGLDGRFVNYNDCYSTNSSSKNHKRLTNSKLEANTGQIVNNSSWVRNDFLSNMGEEDQKKYAIGKAIQQARGGGDMAGLGKKNEIHEDSETFYNADDRR